MKKILIPIAVLTGGAGVGAAASYGTAALVGKEVAGAKGPAKAENATSFVPVEAVIAPLVLPEGQLAGYVSFDLQLEVPEGEAEAVAQRLPLLLHAINLRTYRAPIASAPDGTLPSIEVFRRVVVDAAAEAFGKGVVRRVAVTKAAPA